MNSPFEDPNGGFVVLVNSDGQHSLWPATIAVPAGWTVTFGPTSRHACLEWVDHEWPDLRPRRLVAATGAAPDHGGHR